MTYQVRLPVFEGPLDLLLHLIQVQEIDIYDIPIAQITAQYLAYLELMEAMELDVAGEWLLMAATLTYIKSRMLLPRDPEAEELEEEEDPRQELVERLLEYKRIKALADELQTRELVQRDVFGRPRPEDWDQEEIVLDVSLADLLSAFMAVMERMPRDEARELVIEGLSVTEMIPALLERLEVFGEMAFEALLEGCSSRAELVVAFLALLEMIRLGMVRIEQAGLFGPIRVRLLASRSLPHELD
jgi:segregation and condensation protein A